MKKFFLIITITIIIGFITKVSSKNYLEYEVNNSVYSEYELYINLTIEEYLLLFSNFNDRDYVILDIRYLDNLNKQDRIKIRANNYLNYLKDYTNEYLNIIENQAIIDRIQNRQMLICYLKLRCTTSIYEQIKKNV